MSESAATSSLDALLAEIRERRNEFDRLRHIPQDIVEKFRAIGVYRAFVPRELGGDEGSPAAFCELIEQIAEADGSAGWVASFGMSSAYLAALPPETFAKVYAKSPDVVFAGALFPPSAVPSEPGGFLVSGRWNYCSGCHGASLIGVGIKPTGGDGPALPRMAVMPRENVRIESNWDVIGMRATGSDDVVCENVFVPEEWTFVRGSAARQTHAPYRYPSLALASQVLAVCGLGVARAAIDDMTRIAVGAGSITGAPRPADRAYVQIELAKADARLRAARAWFYDTIEGAYEKVLAGDELSLVNRNQLRMVATHAAHTAADAARTAFTLAGSSAIFNGHPMSRYLHDALVVSQHAFLAEGTWQSAGAAALGLPLSPGYP